jgi:heme/copper-type cytochrome/quinol oxidase subunit 2
MKSLDVIGNFFIPNVFDILGLFSGKKKAFKLDIWAVDDFFIDCQQFCAVSYVFALTFSRLRA